MTNPRIACPKCGAVFPEKPFLDLRKMVERHGAPKCTCGTRMDVVEPQPNMRVTQMGPGVRS